MASSKSRQRELARAKYHRQMVRKAQAERRRRQLQAGLAGLVVVLVTLGGFWLGGAFDPDPKPQASDVCLWTPKQNTDGTLKDVGTPSTTDVPTAGTRPMNITFAQGVVETTLDLASAPCTSASFAFLASKSFFDNTRCHRLTDALLHCGDPSGTGGGGPTYQVVDENVPPEAVPAAPTPTASASPAASPSPVASASPSPTRTPSASPGAPATPTPDPRAGKAFYGKGAIATYNTGPGTNGSQFLIVYKDTYLDPRYSRFGTVTKGLEIVEKIARDGAVGADGKPATEGKPKNDVVIQLLTVGEVVAPTPGPTPGLSVPSDDPDDSPAPTPSATPSPSPSTRP